VLDEFAEVGVCAAYMGDSKTERSLPLTIAANAVCVTKTLPGWQTPTTEARSWEDLPVKAREYVAFVEREAGVPVSYISVGPERSQIIVQPAAPMRAPAVVR